MKNFNYDHFPSGKWRKILVFMRLQLVLLLCSVGTLAAYPSFSQQKKLDVAYREVSIASVLNDLKTRTGYQFLYYKEIIPQQATVTMSKKNATLEEILNETLIKNGLRYLFEDDLIVISRIESSSIQQQVPLVTVAGVVRDIEGKPLVGVSVTVKGSNRGMATGMNGKYSIMAREDEVIAFSFIGKKTVEIRYIGQQTLDVRMEDEATQIDQVIINGFFDRPAESFTGSATSFSQKELLEAGNQNLIKSLGNLDPSFIIMDNLEFGSDPNRMPEIIMRGQSSFPDLQGEYTGNPNQPLFILDGYETSIEKVYDLDMNRVENITILKDAAAKAIYGSKAGNGVVVIQTVSPKVGELRVHYSGTLDIEAPDLNSYNLMNSSEKLAFEAGRGMYTTNSAAEQLELDRLYELYRDNVMKGVDTYWLSKPLRVGVGHKHSVSFEGGDSNMRYSAGFNYNGVKGVMKGSGRETFSANTILSYSYKNLLFRNTIEFTRNNSSNSPYGTFSDYAKLNPYWIPYDDEGSPNIILGTYMGTPYYNPLYNATLNTKNTSSYTAITDNFQMDWHILTSLKLTGRFSYTHNVNESDLFYPASHTMFNRYDSQGISDQKGRYTRGEGKSQSIQGNIGFNFSKIFNKHMIFANAVWNVSDNSSENRSYTAIGFGNDKMDDIVFATKYAINGKPAGYSNAQREVGVIGAVNYSYDDRYLFDASFRTSASSVFGDEAKWGSFWSLGVGWNLHKESFMHNAKWLDRFKLRGSVGYTGSQNFDSYQSKARYRFTDTVYDDRYGALLVGLPNSNLKWQRILDYNVGIDVSLLGRIGIKFDYFITETDDLVIDLTTPPSLGFTTYKENLGKVENKGFDIMLSVTPWRNASQRGWLTISFSGMHNKNVIKKISNALSDRNESLNGEKETSNTDPMRIDELRQQYTRPSTLYYEGQSMTSIWGVRSVGIDPATGKELYYDLDGNHTYNWLTANQTVIGDNAPELRGNIGLNAGYRGFSLALTCSYKFGGDMYNTTLVDKLENATGRDNVDRRMADVWLNPGDVSQYKKSTISSALIAPDYTKPTSRFVMKDNEIHISSLSVGYDFQSLKVLEKTGVKRLKLSFYMNDLARISSVGIERGTSYPYARNFSMTLQATF